MTGDPWRFGVEPLAQTRRFASAMRNVAAPALAQEDEHPALERLIDELGEAEQALARHAPVDPGPRVGPGAADDRRVYVDHSQDIGAFNPCFPEYAIAVDGDRASGTVSFPIVYEGPPGIVHGGFLALFFDCAIQHHNCELGQAGRTASLTVSYHRPVPVLTGLDFGIERSVAGRRITSTAVLSLAGVDLCRATMDAAVGDRSRLPVVHPRRSGP
jgi:hypothetical protein